jgi:hydroxymethylbilane synthase
MIRIGTRGSPLALTQAGMVQAALASAHGLPDSEFEIVTVTTSGDRIQDRALAEVGGKALWTKELDRALLAREIDMAVHSMKDVETIRPVAIAIAAMLERADVRDRLIGAASIEALPTGARVGTSSPRRSAQMLALRPDLSIVLFRGNVATRLAKLERGEADATLLAAAGLDRLGHPDVGSPVPIETLLPAPAQGAVGVECRAEDSRMRALIGVIDHPGTSTAVKIERSLLAALGADCRSPVAALATCQGASAHLRATLYANDGSAQISGEIAEGVDLGERLAADLLGRAPPEVRALFAG